MSNLQDLQSKLKAFEENEQLLKARIEELTASVKQSIDPSRLKELEESEARLRMAIASTKLGTWDYNPITRVLTWSEECKKIYGVPEGTTINFDVFTEHIHPEDRECALAEIQKSMDPAGDGLYDIIFRILRFDDKTIRWIRAQGNVYFDTASEPLRFIGTVVDITETKIAEEKAAKLAAIIETSDDAIISKDLNSIITSWNISAERTFGYTECEMIGQSILKLIPPDRVEEEPHILSRLKRGERVEHFETKRVTKYGKLLDVSLTISPIKDKQGNIIGLSKIARDITEKKREELKKHDFIAMVSHELKTPLTSIQAYIQLLMAKTSGIEDSFVKNALTRTDVQAKKMNAMIQDFLNLARLEEGKIQMGKTIFELNPMIEEIVSDFRLVTSSHRIDFKGCPGFRVNADKDKIGQVLINLLSNASKYSTKGTNIYVDCKCLENKITISVKDEGVGISKRDQMRLFDRFYRVENEKMKNVSGFGIGLYLVSEILRYHNSSIHVESKEDVGSTFYFSLDIVQ